MQNIESIKLRICLQKLSFNYFFCVVNITGDIKNFVQISPLLDKPCRNLRLEVFCYQYRVGAGGHLPSLNLEFFVPIFRIAFQSCFRERNPNAKQEKYLS